VQLKLQPELAHPVRIEQRVQELQAHNTSPKSPLVPALRTEPAQRLLPGLGLFIGAQQSAIRLRYGEAQDLRDICAVAEAAVTAIEVLQNVELARS
jgi:hypothetical protein